MPIITEGNLTFTFPEDWKADKYDDWTFYKKQFQKIAEGTKAVDILAIDNTTSWLTEVKDYRRNRRTKPIDIVDEIAIKVKDSLAGLAAARFQANNEDEKQFADNLLQSEKIRLVLHLEQPAKHSKLFPRAINPANVRQKLKMRLKAVDPHVTVLDKQNCSKFVQWNVN